MTFNSDTALLERIASALQRLAPPPAKAPDFDVAEAFVWQAEPPACQPGQRINRRPLQLPQGLDQRADMLPESTERCARGLPANNALLWGARAVGTPSRTQAAHPE